jgi:hypothetical protein
MANQITTDEGPVNPMNRGLPMPVLLAALPSLRRNGNDAMLGALLGLAKRNRKRKRRVRLQAMQRKWRGLAPAERKKKLAAWLATQSAAKKARLSKRLAAAAARRKALLARRTAMVKAAVKKSPKLRKRIVRRLLQRQLSAARDLPSDQSSASVPQGDVPSPPAVNAPSDAPVSEDFHPTPAETVEKASDDSAENAYEDAAEAAEEGTEAATEEVENEAVEATESEEAAESMTEPTEEENAEEAEATVNEDEEDEGAEASEDEATAGASLLGAHREPYAQASLSRGGARRVPSHCGANRPREQGQHFRSGHHARMRAHQCRERRQHAGKGGNPRHQEGREEGQRESQEGARATQGQSQGAQEGAQKGGQGTQADGREEAPAGKGEPLPQANSAHQAGPRVLLRSSAGACHDPGIRSGSVPRRFGGQVTLTRKGSKRSDNASR